MKETRTYFQNCDSGDGRNLYLSVFSLKCKLTLLYASPCSSSFTCGLAGAIASNPVDVVRTRLMNQRAIVGSVDLYKGTLDGLVKVRSGMESFLALNGKCGRFQVWLVSSNVTNKKKSMGDWGLLLPTPKNLTKKLI